uniref:Uncharacterized protein n=1 Tax=Glossina brevipalpis TaxID=37001 RepID=A0A1A9WWS4_9MUSC
MYTLPVARYHLRFQNFDYYALNHYSSVLVEYGKFGEHSFQVDCKELLADLVQTHLPVRRYLSEQEIHLIVVQFVQLASVDNHLLVQRYLNDSEIHLTVVPFVQLVSVDDHLQVRCCLSEREIHLFVVQFVQLVPVDDHLQVRCCLSEREIHLFVVQFVQLVPVDDHLQGIHLIVVQFVQPVSVEAVRIADFEENSLVEQLVHNADFDLNDSLVAFPLPADIVVLKRQHKCQKLLTKITDIYYVTFTCCNNVYSCQAKKKTKTFLESQMMCTHAEKGVKPPPADTLKAREYDKRQQVKTNLGHPNCSQKICEIIRKSWMSFNQSTIVPHGLR